MSLRVVFMGTPDFAVPTLTEIVARGHRVIAAYSQPPRPAGRGYALTPSPVQKQAEAFGIPVLMPVSLRNVPAVETFAAHEADVAVVVAYGLLLPKPILEAPRHGCLNLHASLLPRWRGAAPIHRAIMAGDAQTGVAVMQMEEGLDTGPICMMEETAVGADETTGALHGRLARLGADLVGRALAALERGTLACRAQPSEGVTYAKKIDKAEARIDWARSAGEVHAQIRGLSPVPGAWFEAVIGGRSERIKVLGVSLAEGGGAAGAVLDNRLTVACGCGSVRLTMLQRAGGKPMAAEDFQRGADIRAGHSLIVSG